MFKQLGQLSGLLSALPRMKEEMEKMQQRLGQLVVEGEAGAGMVKVKANGRLEILSVALTEEALAEKDNEFIEDLFRSAANAALDKARAAVGEETQKLAGGLGLPGMPDLSQMMGS
jgi:DNA-binding YbaB/EbfC family protein